MLLTTEEEIDIQKICPERAMNDMDEEEKAVINKLQFDDKQKKLGLPQSHELVSCFCFKLNYCLGLSGIFDSRSYDHLLNNNRMNINSYAVIGFYCTILCSSIQSKSIISLIFNI